MTSLDSERLRKILLETPDYFTESPWLPNPFVCLRDMVITGTKEIISRLPWNGMGIWMMETWNWMAISHYDDISLFTLPVILALILTLLRIFLNHVLYKVCD